MCTVALPYIIAGAQGLMQVQESRNQAAAYEQQAQADEHQAKIVERQREEENRKILREKEQINAESRYA